MIDLFLDKNLDVVAGIRQPLMLFAKHNPGFEVIQDDFMEIGQGIGVPISREAVVSYLSEFLDASKSCGFVRVALDESGQLDVVITP